MNVCWEGWIDPMVVPISGESMHKLSINNIKVLYDTIRHRDTGTTDDLLDLE